MIFLDENILESQRLLLQQWGIRFRQIGYEAGRKGLKDHEIVEFLLKQHQPTFFSSDRHFFKRTLCHLKYCLVFLEVEQSESALFTRRLLRFDLFNTIAKRRGKVIRVSHTGGSVWETNSEKEKHFIWKNLKR